jgi:hypothetical protein
VRSSPPCIASRSIEPPGSVLDVPTIRSSTGSSPRWKSECCRSSPRPTPVAHAGCSTTSLRAWPLHGTGRRFAEAVLRAYGGGEGVRERALFYHRVGPWHEVLYGIDEDRPELVRSGLDGIRARLP